MSEYWTRIETGINDLVKSAGEWLTEQSWFDDLKMRWQELDPRSRGHVRIGFWSFGGLVGLGLIYSILSGVTGARSDYYARVEGVGLLESAATEMKALKRKTGADTSGEANLPWSDHLARIANDSSMDPAALIVGAETPGKVTDQVKEGIFDLQFKQITIRQLVGFLARLQSAGQPARVDSIEINTVGAEGYLDAKARLTTLTLTGAKK